MDLYQQLKADLQRGRFAPGTPLKQSEIADYYGVSRIPVRDALARLKVEGWLTGHGKRGVAVPLLDPQEAEDLYLMRMRLEPLLLELAAPSLNGELLGRARDILDSMEATPKQTPALDAAEIGRLNWLFHTELYRAAARPTLFNTVEQLQRQCERYIGYQNRSLDYQATSQREHYQLLALLQRGETEKACTLLERHIAAAGRMLVAHLRKPRD
ncbi:GntR family transcriptional regulator [Microbulbifer pacificus]|uniref:GntR family transcriptional regulator n=1 Tax=Microbulbifer pacificus TaxID=407164 RepID=A0AAU0N3T8_9GAMM|nr:GntR family transcriptional regulator [Microbulbifer pacificus]WOX06930.1 GntR family transcriptional regulator [Microbulbifer pacificus]